MKKATKKILAAMIIFLIFQGCAPKTDPLTEDMKARLAKFEEVTLTTDLSWLSEDEREIIRILIDVADIMDEIFWMQSYGDKEELFAQIENENARQYARIHYGPWSRIDNNQPFYPGFGEKPEGANFYPTDMTREEFEA
ncbi:MAG: Zn-dependent hydrolase, partial [Bacteroidota bacterium]